MTQTDNRPTIKICIVTISLAKGGAERSTALLSQMLNKQGFDVHLVTLTNEIDYEYAGTIFNLGLFKNRKNTFLSRLQRFQKLKQFIRKGEFDYIIDNRNRSNEFKELYYLHYLYNNQKVIYVVRSFKLAEYFPKNKYVVNNMISKAHKIVGVSKQIADKINMQFNTDKSVAIYNPVSILEDSPPYHTKGKYILFLGRYFEKVKNFTLLLNAFKKSEIYTKGVHLKIMGEGPDESLIRLKIKELGVEDYVTLVPFSPQIKSIVTQAEFLALTSYYEGFPRVLIEALSVGTPVVSVNCNSGPAEIIENEYNGLLIENHNPEALAEAFRKMILDTDLLAKCSLNAKKSIAYLHIDVIAIEWTKLLQDEKH